MSTVNWGDNGQAISPDDIDQAMTTGSRLTGYSLQISTYLHNIVETYQEFPPIFSAEKNRWGDDWNHYGTDPPLLEKSEQAFHEIYLEEATDNTWVNYVRLAEKKDRSLVLDLTKTKRIIDWSAML
jgi:hypothetical protein